MQLSEADKQFVEANRHHYDTLIKADFLKHLDGSVKDEMERVIGIYQPGYRCLKWCGDCVVNMVKLLYKLYDENNPA